jgi:hypothetical protein
MSAPASREEPRTLRNRVPKLTYNKRLGESNINCRIARTSRYSGSNRDKILIERGKQRKSYRNEKQLNKLQHMRIPLVHSDLPHDGGGCVYFEPCTNWKPRFPIQSCPDLCSLGRLGTLCSALVRCSGDARLYSKLPGRLQN